jgi:ElaB/YqjD/DUF883 family membrane-anchored ribosome-binding protein
MSSNNGATQKTQTANDAAQAASDELKELGREFRKRAEDVRQEVVKQLHSAADLIRKEAKERNAADPTLKDNADKLARGLEKTASYLNSRNIDQLGGEATRVVSHNPWRSIGLVFVIGLIVGLLLRRDD